MLVKMPQTTPAKPEALEGYILVKLHQTTTWAISWLSIPGFRVFLQSKFWLARFLTKWFMCKFTILIIKFKSLIE